MVLGGHSGTKPQPHSFPVLIPMGTLVAVSSCHLVPLPVSMEAVWAEQKGGALPSMPRTGPGLGATSAYPAF